MAENPKAEIAAYKEQLKQAEPQAKSQLLLQLTLAYLKDQETEKAFQTFLAALETLPKKAAVKPRETKEYREALSLYLNSHESHTIQTAAKEITAAYSEAAKEQPQLLFILAAAEANLGELPNFFQNFYQAYQQFPEHYLAYRTLAIIHYKLYALAKTPALKEQQSDCIYRYAMQAIDLEPKDAELYKLIIVTTGEKNKSSIVRQLLRKIISENIIIPRSDIKTYALEAVAIQDRLLAEEFVNKSREWYRYSRSIDEVERLVKSSQY